VREDLSGYDAVLVGDCLPVVAAVAVAAEVEKDETKTLSRVEAISLSRSCTQSEGLSVTSVREE
jgi:hypothetical protein